LSGLKTYLRDNAPAETLLQSLNRTEHTIKSGETLSTIAQRYDVRVDQLRSYNALENDRILEGQVLLIPSGS
jgi:N-acetylmuramoyl-L-alanine amidase